MASSTKVKFTLLASEWGSKHGGLSTFNRVLAIELAKHPKVHVSVLVPRCDQKEIDDASNKNVTLVPVKSRPGLSEMSWLCFPPDDLQIDIVIGHGAVLGSQAQIIRENREENRPCKWMQFVHTDPEELGMFKNYPDPIAKGEQKHQTEVKLCVMADFVVAVGPKLAEEYRSYLRSHKKDETVFVFTPGIFGEFSDVEQASQDGDKCRVLAFGRGDAEDFSLKGFDIAAEAVGKLQEAELIVVGAANKQQDEVADKLKQYIPRDRLRVRAFLESREHLRHLFCEVDLAIMPSRTEGFGLAALEALSAGLPILVGGNSGFGEALAKVPFGSGCVIKSEEPMVWAKEIKKVWAKDRKTRLKESDALRTSYTEEYSWKKQCNDLVDLVKGIVADGYAETPGPTASTTRTADPKAASASAEYANPDPERPKQTAVPAGASAKVTAEPRVAFKEGELSDRELNELAGKIGAKWETLGIHLDITQNVLDGIGANEKDKPYRMLLHWNNTSTTLTPYEDLYQALRHPRVGLNKVAKEFCCK